MRIFTVFYHRTPRVQAVFVILLGSAMAVLWLGLVAAGQSNYATGGAYSPASVWKPVENQAACSAWQRCDGLDCVLANLAMIIPRGAEPGRHLVVARQDNKEFELSSDAVIIEEQPLESENHPDRALILWMVNPTNNPSDAQKDPEEPYMCPDEARGSCYSGPTRVSLLNTTTRTVINTIEIKDGHFDGVEGLDDKADSFDIPYLIRKGYYYHVEGDAPEGEEEGEGPALKGEEMKARVMWLQDYNGDGKALEFALFDAADCMGLLTTLIGYSEWQDRVIQYPVYLEVESDEGHRTELLSWCDYLFSEKPTSPGHWKYEIDYRGRGGSLDKYEIRYDAQYEMFVGTLVWTADEHEKQ